MHGSDFRFDDVRFCGGSSLRLIENFDGELDKVAVALLHVARPPVSEHSMYLIFLLSLKSGVRKYCEPVKNQRNMFESGIRKKTLYLNTRDSPFNDTFS